MEGYTVKYFFQSISWNTNLTLISQCILTVWCSFHSKITVNRSSENMLTYALLSFLFFNHGFIQIILVFLTFYLLKLMLLNFSSQKASFSTNTIFFIDEKHTQWNLDTKVKVFHQSILCFMKYPWNCTSWNTLKEIFHSVSFPLNKQ